MADESDERLELSSAALEALADFERAQLLTANEFAVLETATATDESSEEPSGGHGSLQPSLDYRSLFQEDWNKSQFWYDEATSSTLAREVSLRGQKVAFLCSPTAYSQWKEIRGEDDRAVLFEVDTRFKHLMDKRDRFVYYDYNKGTEERSTFHVILIDPPFLTLECHDKVSQVVKCLSNDKTKLIIASGAVLHEHLIQMYDGLHMTRLRPRHQGGRLSNDFRVWINYQGQGDWQAEEGE